MKERVIQALKDALAAMNNEGAHWAQGELRRGDGDEAAYCSLGAVYLVTDADLDRILETVQDNKAMLSGDFELRREVVAVLSDTIGDEMPWDEVNYQPNPGEEPNEFHKNQWRITRWNDETDREWWEVVELFERAQKQAEGAPDPA